MKYRFTKGLAGSLFYIETIEQKDKTSEERAVSPWVIHDLFLCPEERWNIYSKTARWIFRFKSARKYLSEGTIRQGNLEWSGSHLKGSLSSVWCFISHLSDPSIHMGNIYFPVRRIQTELPITPISPPFDYLCIFSCPFPLLFSWVSFHGLW